MQNINIIGNFIAGGYNTGFNPQTPPPSLWFWRDVDGFTFDEVGILLWEDVGRSMAISNAAYLN